MIDKLGLVIAALLFPLYLCGYFGAYIAAGTVGGKWMHSGMKHYPENPYLDKPENNRK